MRVLAKNQLGVARTKEEKKNARVRYPTHPNGEGGEETKLFYKIQSDSLHTSGIGLKIQ